MLQTLLGAGAVPQGHGPLLRAPRRRGGDRRGVRAVLRRRQPARSSRSSCAGTRRPARPRSWPPATTMPQAKTYRLDVAQVVPPTPGQPIKEPMVIPLVTGLLGRDGRDLPLKLADGKHDRARRAGARQGRRRASSSPASPQRPVLSTQSRLLGAGQAHRQSHRRTTCGCWRRTTATRSIAGRRCRRWRPRCWSATSRGCAPARSRRWTKGCSMRSRQSSPTRALEPAFVAEALSPPSEADIAREIGRDVDPDAIFRARAALRALIGLHLNAALTAAYRTPGQTASPTAPTPRAPAGALLKNVCLDLLAATQESHAIRLAAKQYQAADNMTDRMAALSTLSLHDVPERDAALRRLLPALSRRPADHRQMVRAAGHDARARDARPRARAHRRIRPSRWPIPTACAR